MEFINCIKEIISLRNRPLEFLNPDELPEDIPTWLVEHGTDVEICVLTGIVFCLVHRGTEPVDCARYALDSRIELPFRGCEEKLIETVFASILANDISPQRLAQLVEFLGFAGEVMQQMTGSEQTKGNPFSGYSPKEPARA